jgi:membrane protease YdiL (CAAX protease family)
MDRRSLVIMVVIGSELFLRLAYQYLSLPVDPLVYTGAARILQTVLILYLAFNLSGFPVRSLQREVLIGISVSLSFGALVLLSDLASRLALQGGWLQLVLARQTLSNPLGYFFVACVLGPFAEELFFRGILYSWLRERMPAAAGIVLSALFFAGLHPGFLIQLIGGLLFATVFEWRRNIWAAFIVHATANLGIWIVPCIYPFW